MAVVASKPMVRYCRCAYVAGAVTFSKGSSLVTKYCIYCSKLIQAVPLPID